MLTCKDSIELLQRFVDGDMPSSEATQLEEHLAGCAPCVDFVNTYRATPTLCRRVLQKTMPSALVGRLNEFLKSKCGK